MKKWLLGCLLALGLLLCVGSAMADGTINCKVCGEWTTTKSAGVKFYDRSYHREVDECTKCHTQYDGQFLPHSGGERDCYNGKICTECKGEYTAPLGHDLKFSNVGKGRHSRICTRCDYSYTVKCFGGTATCTEKAVCMECGAAYGNALGHQWEVTYQWSNGNANCTAYRTCQNNAQHSDSVEGAVTRTYTEPTCSTPDKTTYTATFSASWAETQVRTTSTGTTWQDAHKWGDATYTWSPDYTSCTAKRVCTLNSSHTETEVAEAFDTVFEVTSCTDDGSIIHTATFKASWADTQTKTVKISAPGHDLVHHEAQAATCTEIGWEAYDTCKNCAHTTYKEISAPGHDLENHDAKAATCTEIGWDAYVTCKREGCKHTTYKEIAALNHDLEDHAAKAPTCTEIGWEAYKTCKRDGCKYTTYKAIPALNHDLENHDAKAATCTEIGWDAYVTCKREGCKHTTYKEIAALNHDLEDHAAKAPTCTEIGWDAYVTCKREGCNYTTYQEIAALNHDLLHHDAKTPTCTEIGWNEYDACTRCKYTTYSELPIDPNNHDLVHHDAQAATCTEIGWDEYDTCTRCDYTTYVELPALGHDYQKTVVQPTCEKGGYTCYTCSRCEDTYTENPVKKLLHWYGEWMPNGDGTHSADCRREGCKHTGKVECETFDYRLLFADAEDYIFGLCPVCGEVSDGARLALVTEAIAKAEHLPQGELVLRLDELQNGEYILSVGFEYGGKLTRPTEPVEITLPAELLEGYALKLLDADGMETELPFAVTEDTTTFTLNFDAQDEIPVRAIRLVPVQ